MICPVMRAAIDWASRTAWPGIAAQLPKYPVAEKAVSALADQGWFVPSRIPDPPTKKRKKLVVLPFYFFAIYFTN